MTNLNQLQNLRNSHNIFVLKMLFLLKWQDFTHDNLTKNGKWEKFFLKHTYGGMMWQTHSLLA